jgi:cell wall-associated NlpC family hydrolase
MASINTPLGTVAAVPYPGRIIKVGDTDASIVKKIEQRLNAVGCGPIAEDGVFDKAETERAVKLFQTRFTDTQGNPLKNNGQIGPLTWGAMFGASSVPSTSHAPTSLTKEAITFATTQIGVLEHPLGSNRGPEVDKYLAAVGLGPNNFWCVAFTYFCYQQAANKLGVPNPHIKTAGVLNHWNKAKNKSGALRITKNDAVNNPGLITPGSLFIIDNGGGFGHTGIVTGIVSGLLETIEGNTNPGGSSNGIGVFKRNARKINSINKGFIEYT